jgi:hypothetical protein
MRKDPFVAASFSTDYDVSARFRHSSLNSGEHIRAELRCSGLLYGNEWVRHYCPFTAAAAESIFALFIVSTTVRIVAFIDEFAVTEGTDRHGFDELELVD